MRLLLEQFYISFLTRFCLRYKLFTCKVWSQTQNLPFYSFCTKIVIFDVFSNFLLEYKSTGVEKSKKGFGFAVAQKLIELEPPTSKIVGGSEGRIIRDRGPIFFSACIIYTLAIILYFCNSLIGGPLHAANRVSKFLLFWKTVGQLLEYRSTHRYEILDSHKTHLGLQLCFCIVCCQSNI